MTIGNRIVTIWSMSMADASSPLDIEAALTGPHWVAQPPNDGGVCVTLCGRTVHWRYSSVAGLPYSVECLECLEYYMVSRP